MSESRKFIDLALEGRVMSDEIDNFIDAWHESDSSEEIHDYLGLTAKEYSLWVSHPDYIDIIIAARHHHRPIIEAVNDNLRSQERLAARADEARKIAALKQWIAAQSDR